MHFKLLKKKNRFYEFSQTRPPCLWILFTKFCFFFIDGFPKWVAILSDRCETVLKLLQTHSGTWRRSWQMPLKLTLKNILGYTMTIEIKTGCSILCWNQHLEKKYGAKTREESEWWPFWEMRGRVAAFDGDINRRRVMGGNWCLSQSVSQE